MREQAASPVACVGYLHLPRLRQTDGCLDRSPRLGAVLPAGGADDGGRLGNDVERVGAAEVGQGFEPHLFKADHHGGADAFDAEQCLAFFCGKGHVDFLGECIPS